MTAKITFERAGGRKIRISLVADVEVSGLSDILGFLATAVSGHKYGLSGDARDNDDQATGMLTVEEAAEVLHISRDKVYFLIRTGQLRSIKIGKLRRLSPAWIAEFINSRSPE